MGEGTGNGAGGAGEGGGGGKEVTLESVQAELKTANEKIATMAGTEDTIKGLKADMMTYKNKAKELEGERDAQRKKKADGETDIDKLKSGFQEIFDANAATISGLNGKLRDVEVYGNIRSIATKHGASYPDDVVTLLKSRITFDDKGDTVIDGGKLNEKTGKAFTLDELTTTFLAGRTDLVKSSGNQGAGSSGGSGGASGGIEGFKDLADLARRGTQDQYNKLSPQFLAQMRKG